MKYIMFIVIAATIANDGIIEPLKKGHFIDRLFLWFVVGHNVQGKLCIKSAFYCTTKRSPEKDYKAGRI